MTVMIVERNVKTYYYEYIQLTFIATFLDVNKAY